jgi:hypothetical protein
LKEYSSPSSTKITIILYLFRLDSIACYTTRSELLRVLPFRFSTPQFSIWLTSWKCKPMHIYTFLMWKHSREVCKNHDGRIRRIPIAPMWQIRHLRLPMYLQRPGDYTHALFVVAVVNHMPSDSLYGLVCFFSSDFYSHAFIRHFIVQFAAFAARKRYAWLELKFPVKSSRWYQTTA